MDPPGSVVSASASLGILKRRLIDILEEDADALLDELSSLLPQPKETYKRLNTAETNHEKVEMILQLILDKGEKTCGKFIQHLENMTLRFPRLSSLSGNFPEMNFYIFKEFMTRLKMEEKIKSKLTLQNVLSIGTESLEDTEPQNIEDLPWHFLRKIMALNRNARRTQCVKVSFNALGSSVDNDIDDALSDFEAFNDCNVASPSVHPLDMVCALLHCSDHFLQQEIVSKMSMCQFAVPLLLPAGDGTYCTLMLWAMRDIVKRWTPHSLADSKGFMEDNVVNVPMPTFSFVRLGKTKLSKSKILNQVLSQEQQHLDFFIHDNMEGGNIERKISNGLVEMSWYFPSGSESSDIFPEPIAVTNLRGDLESNWNQFSFLTRVSSAVFIFTERISEMEFRILSNCDTSSTKYYLIITPSPGKEVTRETIQNLQKWISFLKIEKNNIVIKKRMDNDKSLAEKIKSLINSSLIHSHIKVNFHDAVNQAGELPAICVDEHSETCRIAKEYAQNITKDIKDVTLYKKYSMSLQGDLWKQVSEIEKEMCRMRKQGGKDTQEYQSELIRQRISLHEKQYAHTLPPGIMLFIDAFVHLSHSEKHYFLKWMKLELDSIARRNLFDLQTEYKEKCNKEIKNKEELKELDQKICDSSLGIEHFLREMGQFYEAECSMLSKNLLQEKHRQYTQLPGMAADHLLDGFPLELIDGDASNIPMQWITDILTELDTKTGGRYRMRVISVLGVQSTGKSTLLNTMFGLQFPVASGRCTRGAFMTLINVKEIYRNELGCDFILVIDTEGLKAPELASLEHSYEHDNELATLVIGLSDITIINMAMENAAEMTDTLQIVVHAFLRMKTIGKKPKCLFVHQNVSDVSANQNNMRDTMKLLELLDEMTRVAANMENISEITTFNSIIDYDPDNNNWYVPGLCHGVPPMAPVNHGYSETVYKLKMSLCEYVKICNSVSKPHGIKDFITWIKSLWNAVKHETFIFSFRNSLVAQAYNKLSIRFSQWEWDFTKAVYSWRLNTETRIRNQSLDTLHTDTLTSYLNELQRLLFEEEKKMTEKLGKYFVDKSENVNLIEKYKVDFELSVRSLKSKCERNADKTIRKTFQIQTWKLEIQRFLGNFQETLGSKVKDLLESCRMKSSQLSDTELKKEFEITWEKTITDLQIKPLPERNVSQSMLQQVYNNMSGKGPDINERITNMKSIEEYDRKSDKAIQEDLLSQCDCNQELHEEMSTFIKSLIQMCDQYVNEIVKLKSNYDDTYCLGMLHQIDEKLKEMKEKKMPITSVFELEVKLVLLGRAAPAFQTMHKEYIQENDPIICLEKKKPGYLETFRITYHNKDQSKQSAEPFCDLCLKPALMEYIYKHLGQEIMDDILQGSDNITFRSRSFFQAAVLENLLEKEEFRYYKEYIKSYESFLKTWILDHISDKYRDPTRLQPLQANLLSDIIPKIRSALTTETYLQSPNTQRLLENLREEFRSELVISQDDVNMVASGDTVDIAQFCDDIQTFLPEIENQILTELESLSIGSVLSKVTVKPQDELLEMVKGCGKQCPFCKVPCEAGGSSHKEHFASIHRPEGLGGVAMLIGKTLCTGICSYSVVTNETFLSPTNCNIYPYREYRKVYSDWRIQPDPSIEFSDYWKYVFVKFNKQFAEKYKAEPAKLPAGWKEITKEQALRSLKQVYNKK
uniref:VLIG-type G domain-containing protein n=1 Tax=Leptobrachium leishanense TaxID=445787 RepID=A0A8C5Q1B8_9ANUR